MTSCSLRLRQTSLSLVPLMNSMKMYSVPAPLFESGEYPYILGIGRPAERRKSMVATSLATAKYLDTVIRYGTRATIWNWSTIVMRKARLKLPSPSFDTSATSARPRPADAAASRHSSSTLKTSLRSARRSVLLKLNKLDYEPETDAIEQYARDLRPASRGVVEEIWTMMWQRRWRREHDTPSHQLLGEHQ